MTAERESPAEADLIALAKQGDQAAFGLLVNRYQDQVYNLVCRTVGDVHHAQDVAQEAFIRAWRALPQFEERSKFSSWLYRISINCSFTELRRLKRPLDQIPTEEFDSPKFLDPLESSQEAEFEKRDLVERLMKGLSPIYRSIVVLFYLQEMDCQEIATVLNKPVGTVKAYLHRARAELKLSTEKLLRTRKSR